MRVHKFAYLSFRPPAYPSVLNPLYRKLTFFYTEAPFLKWCDFNYFYHRRLSLKCLHILFFYFPIFFAKEFSQKDNSAHKHWNVFFFLYLDFPDFSWAIVLTEKKIPSPTVECVTAIKTNNNLRKIHAIMKNKFHTSNLCWKLKPKRKS